MDSTLNQSNQNSDTPEKISRRRRREIRTVNNTSNHIDDFLSRNLSVTTSDVLAITKEIESFAIMPLTNFGTSDNPAILSEIKRENLLFLFDSLKKLTGLLQHEVEQMIKFERHRLEMSNKLD
ncbi:hypothetical protein ACET6Q_07095 [Aeromonas dhakensis]|uniref:hypothetical protein n=1 Tax=Aeromonas TaxID=642 RepID=UPI002B49F40E|nr:hypothetical protein [Aeromonas caviae]